MVATGCYRRGCWWASSPARPWRGGSLQRRGVRRSPAAGRSGRLGERRRGEQSPGLARCGLLLALGAYPFIEAS